MDCPECGYDLTSKIEVDELSDGTIVGCRIYWCENCSEWFDQEEIDEHTGKSDQDAITRSGMVNCLGGQYLTINTFGAKRID